MNFTLNSPLTVLGGVGPARADQLAKLGLHTLGDLLTYYPRDYQDRRQIWSVTAAPLGEKTCVRAMVADYPRLSRVRAGLELVKAKAVDGAGVLNLTFFNQRYVEKALTPGREYVFYGVVEEQGRSRSMTNPEFEPADRGNVTGRIVPVYPLTAGVSNLRLANLVAQALPLGEGVEDCLPHYVRQDQGLAAISFALENIHRPSSYELLEVARRRLIFEELFYLSVGLTFLKSRRRGVEGGQPIPPRPVEEFVNQLPFTPTDAQLRVMGEILTDLSSSRPMNRLVQGDVGSGKTVIAAFAGWLVAKAGRQGAMMAPTEVLARQHFRTLHPLLGRLGVRVGLLTGSMTAKEKREVREELSSGRLDFLVGTHALLSEGVDFHALALMVADEQHRFGVAQRSALAAKGDTPHVLVMSATPIPRTLALMMYGDLDVSLIDQLPPGRTPVDTFVIHEDKRARMYSFVRKLVGEGRQVYIICPAVEEGEEDAPDLKSVKAYAAQLEKKVFPDLTVDLLHGKMRPREKDRAMAAFAAGETQVLVATTVVEVGVDVANAALIIVENAERFGLSQLHQLRGRVGRGAHHSYCVLMTRSRQEEAMRRLKTLASTTDGFQIAQADLEQRGPGDFFGSRQHGLPQLKLADLAGDMSLLDQARGAAVALLALDPALEREENGPVLRRVRAMFSETPDIFN